MNVPVKISITHTYSVSEGHPRAVPLEILCDSVSETAPIHINSIVTCFANLKADLSLIPKDEAMKFIQRKPDGQDYYCFEGAVEATFCSASMEYVFVIQSECNKILAGAIDSSKHSRGPV